MNLELPQKNYLLILEKIAKIKQNLLKKEKGSLTTFQKHALQICNQMQEGSFCDKEFRKNVFTSISNDTMEYIIIFSYSKAIKTVLHFPDGNFGFIQSDEMICDFNQENGVNTAGLPVNLEKGENKTRKGWSEQFSEMHKNGHDEDLLEQASLPKPVFVVRVPFGYTVENDRFQFEMKELVKAFETQYIVIMFIERDLTSFQFEMFSVNNASVVDFEELKLVISKNFESKTGVFENGLGEDTCLGGFAE